MGARGIALLVGVLGVLSVSIPVAWSRGAAENVRETEAQDANASPGLYPAAHAITGAKIVTGTGKTYEPGTIVIRHGVIEAVGLAKDVTVPYDAEIIDGKGLVVYPGFIDLYTTIGQRAGVERSATGKGRPVDLSEAPLIATPPDNRKGLTPEFQAASAIELAETLAEPRRRLGFTDLVSAPSGAIATGQSALVSLSGMPRRESVVAAPVALHVHLSRPTDPPAAGPSNPATPTPGQIPGGRRRGFGGAEGAGENPYPGVLMGVIAHFRQAMLDAEHHQKLEAYYASHGGAKPPLDPALEAFAAARARKLPVWWEANTRDEIHRALDLADEFGTTAVIVGGHEAAKAVDRLKAARTPVVLRLDFPEEPKVPTEVEFLKKAVLERDEPLRAIAHKNAKWKERVAAAAALSKAGVKFAFATDGLERLDTFAATLKKVIAAGLTPDAALAALTRDAAAIAGVDKRLGTLEAGKLGHVIVLSGAFDDEKTKVKHVLIDGHKFDIKEDRTRGRGRTGGPGDGSGPGGPRGPQSKDLADATGDDQPDAAELAEPAKTKRFGGERGKRGGAERADLAVKKEPAKDALVAKKDATPAKKGMGPRPKGIETARTKGMPPAAKNAPAGDEKKNEVAKAAPPAAETKKAAPKPFVDIATELDEDRKPKIHTGGSVLIKNATILTVTKGTIKNGSILIEKGKIKSVGPNTPPTPPGVTVIDATGLVAMPGIIDTHSHIAVQGGVNEGTLSVVPEVRVRDVVTGDDTEIYRAIAGGTTTARLLHGSANTIGGQHAVAKLRYGQPGRDLIIKDAALGVKFALGENVTRSRGRFPNTRMGVESVIERAFEEGRAYRAVWDKYKKAQAAAGGKAAGPPPRVDLRLEALAGILDGSIKIHSHCYRSDEILMLLRTAQRYGVRVQSLQHVLEGYKVAAEIAAHGASASTFSDWWAYKIEAYDAIPHNAALLTEAGANVCIKSDDDELMRHLNLEAAKMVKYGLVSEAQALAMITINPARELLLEDRLGSIEVGKDGDIAIFNGHPFDAFARCELAIIDGEVYFQRKEADGKFAVRPGDHSVMPTASEALRHRSIEIAANPKNLYALVGANLHPVSGPEIKGGTLIVGEGRILNIGAAGLPIPSGAQTIELTGLDIWPGMVDSGSALGLFEVGSLTETQDYADAAQFQPELLSSNALHPDSEHIPVTRANGVLTSFVEPSGGVISGQGCLIDLHGWVPRELLIADNVALNITIPTYIPRPAEGQRPGQGQTPGPGPIPGPTPGPGQGPGGAGGGNEARERRQERLEKLKELFKRAIAYDNVVSRAREKNDIPPTPDIRLQALVPYARGQKPVIFHADQQIEILEALEIARELKLKAIISGGSEAWKVADAIEKAKVPVLVTGTLTLPRHDYDPYDASYTNPAKLHAAGVTVAIRSQSSGSGSATAMRNLPFEAATAIAFGLPEKVALESVTLTPARVLGVADQVGSLEAGKRANLVVTAGHLLQPTTPVLALFIDGEPVRAESRHTQLHAKYRRRLEEVRAGRAKLGIDAPTTKLSGAAAPDRTPNLKQ
jgi:imidazolonepropionase-like amidohydrolase